MIHPSHHFRSCGEFIDFRRSVFMSQGTVLVLTARFRTHVERETFKHEWAQATFAPVWCLEFQYIFDDQLGGNTFQKMRKHNAQPQMLIFL